MMVYSKHLPKTYKGYSTEELVRMYESIGQGGLKGQPKAKILAMDQLLREYMLAPVFQKDGLVR